MEAPKCEGFARKNRATIAVFFARRASIELGNRLEKYFGEGESEADTVVLVVDDEPAVLRIIQLVLEDLGCTVCGAADAESALVLFSERDPDLVVTDVKLPGIDGVELARRIKSASDRDVPVLLISAYGEPPGHPGDAFLSKPFDIDQLSQLVQAHLPLTSQGNSSALGG